MDEEEYVDPKPVGVEQLLHEDDVRWYLSATKHSPSTILRCILLGEELDVHLDGFLVQTCAWCRTIHRPSAEGTGCPRYRGFMSTDRIRSVHWSSEHLRVLRKGLGLDLLLGDTRHEMVRMLDSARIVERVLATPDRVRPWLAAAVETYRGTELPVTSDVECVSYQRGTLQPSERLCLICANASIDRIGFGSHLAKHEREVKRWVNSDDVL